MMKNYLAKNSNGDKVMANSIVNTLRKEAGKARTLGWILLLGGIFLLIIVIGIFFIPMGIWRLSQANRAEKVIDEGYKLWQAENP